MDEPRFYIDHGMIHDRITGRHIHGNREIEPGLADEAVFTLNELHASAIREIKRAAALQAAPAALPLSAEQIQNWIDGWADAYPSLSFCYPRVWLEVVAHQATQAITLAERLASAEQNDRRYRWLRDNCRKTAEARGGCPEHAALVYYYGLKNPNDRASYTAEGLDAAIDQAIAAQPDGGGA